MEYFQDITASRIIGIILLLCAAAVSFGARRYFGRKGYAEEKTVELVYRVKIGALVAVLAGALLVLEVIVF